MKKRKVKRYLEVYRVANGRVWVREIEDIRNVIFIPKKEEKRNGRK